MFDSQFAVFFTFVVAEFSCAMFFGAWLFSSHE